MKFTILATFLSLSLATLSYAGPIQDVSLIITPNSKDLNNFAKCAVEASIMAGFGPSEYLVTANEIVLEEDRVTIKFTSANKPGNEINSQVTLTSFDKKDGWQTIQSTEGKVGFFSTKISDLAKLSQVGRSDSLVLSLSECE